MFSGTCKLQLVGICENLGIYMIVFVLIALIQSCSINCVHIPASACLFHHNNHIVFMCAACRCSFHPLQCNESSEGGGGWKVVGVWGTGILALCPRVKEGSDPAELWTGYRSEETVYFVLDEKRPSGYLEKTHYGS